MAQPLPVQIVTPRSLHCKEAVMDANQKDHTRELNLEKLGIRQIHERIEVSPIITDPGTMGFDVEEDTPKTYICTINLPKPSNPPTDF
ncbi:MAG: hypothetical protein ACI9UQ_002294 [Candidatus Krumholzibacteriia bacterium]|jgi:hypothetical protein